MYIILAKICRRSGYVITQLNRRVIEKSFIRRSLQGLIKNLLANL